MATTILISGVLMDGTGNPIPDCDITLTALRTSRSVVAKTSGLGATSSAGEYSLTVPPGDYRVTLCIDGYPPAEPGMIHVYADSTPGTLNDFLLAPGESDLTPDILKQLEELAKAAKASADAAAGSAAASAASADGAAKVPVMQGTRQKRQNHRKRMLRPVPAKPLPRQWQQKIQRRPQKRRR